MNNATKRSFLTTGLLSAALLALPLAGCKKDADDVPAAQEKVQEAREEVKEQQKDVVEEKKDVAEENRDVAAANRDLNQAKGELDAARDEFVRVSREKLAKIDARIGELEAKGDAKSKSAAADLRIRRNELSARLDRAGDRTNANWQELKADLDTGFDKLQADIDAKF